ncbi:ATP-binding protein [Candidatus Woesearchaeota archaeon]|nr:ATP-binding protein [Candidatus Woesearchaeota archaeon]
MEKAKLEEFNHWWTTSKVDEELALPFKRSIYSEIEGHINKRFILALVGLRRVGKTTIIYQIIKQLLEKNVDKTNILFFSFDEVSAELSEVLETFKEVHNKDFRKEKIYVFLDEIQKCNNWENELKKYYDLYPKLKFIISGSESLFIRKKTKETLAGRIFEFALNPFAFREYLRFNEISEDEFKYETKIKPLFIKFAEKGGFPETFSFETDKEFKEYIRSLVVDKIIYKDIPRIFKLEDPDFLRVLLELIATNPGMYIDYQSLSKQFEKDRRVIKSYITYLKESFLITLLGNYRKGSIITLRKKKRAYPADNALIYLYKPTIDEDFFGKMVEVLVVNKLKASSFWKNSGEIDIVHEDIPIEIKYQEKINSEDFKPIKEFMKKFNKKEGIMITKNEEREIKFEKGIIKLIPVWKWLLEEK